MLGHSQKVNGENKIMVERIAIIGPRQSGKSLIAASLKRSFEIYPVGLTSTLKKVCIINERTALTTFDHSYKDNYDIIIYDGVVPKEPCRMIYTTSKVSTQEEVYVGKAN